MLFSHFNAICSNLQRSYQIGASGGGEASTYRVYVALFFLTESLDLEQWKNCFDLSVFLLMWTVPIKANIFVTFCIIFSFSSGSKLCHHSSDWSRGGVHSPPEPHAVDDSGCIPRSTYPRDPASPHQYTGHPASSHWDTRDPASPHRHTGHSLSNPNQHPRTSACTNRDPAASA